MKLPFLTPQPEPRTKRASRLLSEVGIDPMSSRWDLALEFTEEVLWGLDRLPVMQ